VVEVWDIGLCGFQNSRCSHHRRSTTGDGQHILPETLDAGVRTVSTSTILVYGFINMHLSGVTSRLTLQNPLFVSSPRFLILWPLLTNRLPLLCQNAELTPSIESVSPQTIRSPEKPSVAVYSRFNASLLF